MPRLPFSPQRHPVPAEAVVRGYEYAPDQYVIMGAEELEQLRPARDKALVLEQFVPARDIDATFYAGRSLYLLPDGAAAQHPYGVLAEAMQQAGQGALGRVVLSSQRQLVLVRPCGRLLVVDVLHYPAQVRASAGYAAELTPAAAIEAERALASQLIAMLPCVIVGYRPGREGIRRLLVATVRERELRYVGQLRHGLGAQAGVDLAGRLAARRRVQPVVSCPLRACWVEPALCCRVKYQGWTAQGHLRDAVFCGVIDNPPRHLRPSRRPLPPSPLCGQRRHATRLTNSRPKSASAQHGSAGRLLWEGESASA